MSDFRKFLKENLETDPEFKEIWEKNAQKRELVKTIIALKGNSGHTRIPL